MNARQIRINQHELSSNNPARNNKLISVRPRQATALGKAILAWLPEPEIARVVADHGLAPFTKTSIVSLGELVESLRQVRRHGFAVEDREYREDEIAIGCVIREKAGAVVGSVGASVPVDGPSAANLQQLQIAVSHAAREISNRSRS